MSTFAEQLKAIRKERNITQEWLANAMNVSRPTISHWENGRVIPDIDTIKHLSQVVNYNFLAVEGVGEETQTTPEVEEISAQAEEETAQETTVQQTDASPRKHRFVLPAVLGAVLLCAVVIVCLLVNGKPSDEPANLYEPYTQAWYQQEQTPVEGKAFVSITPLESPVYAVKDENVPEGGTWFYTFLLHERNNIPFTMKEATLTTYYTDGRAKQQYFTTTELQGFFGTVVLDNGQELSWCGGFPIQNIAGMALLISGTDAKGNQLEFHGYVELIPEIREN